MSTTKTILYDTTLRDGTQREGISLSARDKLVIAQKLDELGIDLIEGGWPGSNPKDMAFFLEATSFPFFSEKITAFSATRRKNAKVADDPNTKAVLESGVSTVTLVGKTWDLHVTKALETTFEENLAMIGETVEFFKKKGLRVIYDAEHAFDGLQANEAYALQTLKTAGDAGADCIVLCDTNGGTTPDVLEVLIEKVQATITTPLGIHPHNDCELAIANALVAYNKGIRHLQGTINGFGERCGNMNLCSLIPLLVIKYQDPCITISQLHNLTSISRFVSEVANIPHDNHLPFVGKSAFAHKGGIHASAMAKDVLTYQHIDPEIVGNTTRTVVSELAGKMNIKAKAESLGIAITDTEAKTVVAKIKELENIGFQFESADASLAMLITRIKGNYVAPFAVTEFLVLAEKRSASLLLSEVTVKVNVADEIIHTVSEGNGPVNALDNALRKALVRKYPALATIELLDYKVRILNESEGTESLVRVLIESGNEHKQWSTVGSSTNIIEASMFALIDSLEYGLLYG